MSGVLNLLLAGAASAIKDAYFNLTTLLLNTSSTNGAQNNTFLDSSTNNFSITRNGNVTQGTFTPFSQTGWSNFFNGTDATIISSGTPINIGTTGDFTIEMWVFPVAVSGSFNVIFNTNVTAGFGGGVNSNGTITFGRALTATDGTTTNSVNFKQWNHVAWVRSSGTLKIYINGVSGFSAANSSSYPSGAARIGSDNNNTLYFNGNVSNFRVGTTAVYTANFTPPTIQLTAISGTTILTCQSNRFVDNSSSALTFTTQGTPSVQAFSPFLPTAAYDASVVGGSGYFDGSGDYLSIAAQTALNFGTGDFTLEAWVYPTTTLGDAMCIFSSVSSGGLMFGTNGSPGSGVWALGRRGVSWDYSSSAVPSLNQWQHVAISRSGTSVRIFINGVQSGTTGTNSTSYDLSLGGTLIGYQVSYMNGYFCGVRATNSALYTSNFTPSTAPPTAITNTALLINYTNAGIYDSAAKNVLETVGNAQVSTTQAKWGTTSMSFDGTGDYLYAGNSQNFVMGTGDYTYECWVYHTSVGIQQSYIARTQGNQAGVYLYVNASNQVGVYYSAQIVTNTTTIAVNTWTHIAATRSSGTTRIFVNGTLAGAGSSASDTTNLTESVCYIGASSTAANPMIGYMDDVRITKGYARYTANFTPPSAAFSLQ